MFWSKKRYIKGEKWFTPVDFGEHLRKSDVSENSKDSYEMYFMKGIVILVKNIWDVQYLGSLLATVYWLRDEDVTGWLIFLLESVLECP